MPLPAMPTCDSTRIAELADAYLSAEYRWQLDGGWHWLRVGSPAPHVDATFPETTRFGLLSAWDPHSVPRSEAENRRADEALRHHLASSPYAFRPAFSSAPDRTWREPGWLVAGIPVEPLDDLSHRFGQLGTLFWRRGQPVRLRMHAMPPAGFEGHPDIDWLD